MRDDPAVSIVAAALIVLWGFVGAALFILAGGMG